MEIKVVKKREKGKTRLDRNFKQW